MRCTNSSWAGSPTKGFTFWTGPLGVGLGQMADRF